MANLNKVMLIGRLTRDPEPISAGRGGAKFGFAVNNSRRNPDTQQWEDVPVFIDMEIWNGETSKQAERVLQTLRKGQQVFIEGRLKMDTWEDKNGGGKRTALRVTIENFQYLEPRPDGAPGEPVMRAPRPAATPARPAAATAKAPTYYDDEPTTGAPVSRGGGGAGTEEEIPF